MRNRATILAMAIGIVFVVAACGRASEDDINDLLGIVPTPTLSSEQIAQATEQAEAAASAAAAMAASPGSGPDGAVAAGFDASQGDVVIGRQQFQFKCQQCHRPDGAGTGPALSGPDNPSVPLSDNDIAVLVREGHGTSNPMVAPGLSDSQLAGIIKFLRDQSE
ncbi:MAG: c-type cytochrome [Thermomicrobiales bacterium]|jgi:mono/diheme cytochrome c family protein|nr:c-type cytochrome [Thermomicrobiales bacterium]